MDIRSIKLKFLQSRLSPERKKKAQKRKFFFVHNALSGNAASGRTGSSI
jgi:hypothetical protein